MVKYRLKSIPKDSVVFVQLACGINNLTNKIRHSSGVELIPRQDHEVLSKFRKAKSEIQAIHPNVVVLIATIACVDFVKANKCYKAWNPRYTTNQLVDFQRSFSDDLAQINHEICNENQIPQPTLKIGMVKGINLYWHQSVEKTSFKGKSSDAVIKKKRIPDGALVDGIHASTKIQEKWFEQFHLNMMKLKGYLGV